MGVKLGAGGYQSQASAVSAGEEALARFLEDLERERETEREREREREKRRK
jgi:hypothetical protein